MTDGDGDNVDTGNPLSFDESITGDISSPESAPSSPCVPPWVDEVETFLSDYFPCAGDGAFHHLPQEICQCSIRVPDELADQFLADHTMSDFLRSDIVFGEDLGLVALKVPADGNCLLHSLSLLLWGLQDGGKRHDLRGALHLAIKNDVTRELFQRWKRQESSLDVSNGIHLSDDQYEQSWHENVVDLCSPETDEDGEVRCIPLMFLSCGLHIRYASSKLTYCCA